jgi:hypothetical protein
MSLPKFSRNSKCIKCGGADFHTKYMEANPYRTYYECPCRDEHLHRHCRGCGYSWDEAVKVAALEGKGEG